MAKPARGQYLIVVPLDDRGARLRIESATTRSFSASELVGELRRQATFLEEHFSTPDSPSQQDTLDTARISEYLVVVRVITEHTRGAVGSGVIACPVCHTGELAYAVTATAAPDRHQVGAVCSEAGCIRFHT